jgi:hypothetical protein
MAEETQQAEKVVQASGTTGFGVAQLNKPTPLWVNWIFRTEFVLNKVFLIWLGSQDIIDNAHSLKVIIGIVAAIDGVVWGLGKFVGITKDQMDK